MSDYNQSHRKYLLTLLSLSLSSAVYKPSELVGLVKTDFNGMQSLGLYLLRAVGVYDIFTEFVPW